MTLTLPRRLRQVATRSSAVAATMRSAGHCAAAVLVLAGCTTRWVVEEHESPVMPPAGRETYYWQGGALQTADAIDFVTAKSARSEIETAITAKLADKGYRQVASEKDAAMIVSYVAQIGPSTITEEKPAAIRWPGNVESTFASDLPQKRMMTKNHVVVVIDDPQTRRVLWRGLVDDDVRVSSTQHALELVVAMTGDIAKRIPECRPGLRSSEARL